MTDTILRDTVDRLFAAGRGQAENEGWDADLWARTCELGLPWIGVPESVGGAGGELSDAVEVLRSCGRHGLSLPLAETGMLAGWLAAAANVQLNQSANTVVPGTDADTLVLTDGKVSGTAHRVAWTGVAEWLFALLPKDGIDYIVVLAASDGVVQPGTNLAGEPRGTVTFTRASPVSVTPAPAGITGESLRLRGALTRVALMAGALAEVADLSLKYAQERTQFGRPIGRFQAVGHHLVACVQDAELANMACLQASDAAETGDAYFEIAAAKILCSECAARASREAHQTHGAIGFTREYPLHRLTRRLWAWKSEYGGRAEWSYGLGRMVVQNGADGLYAAITSGSKSL